VAVAVVVGVITAVAWPGPLAATPGGTEVTIVSFNVRGGLRENAMLDADAIVTSIAASDPDVVLVQEVARGWPVFGQYDLLARLSQRLRMPYRYEPAADAQFGNAIFSRLPMTPVAAGPLPEVEGSQGRSFLAVRVDTTAGPLLVANAHLESDSVAQIDALLLTVAGEAPAVVGGDLNMETTDTANVERFVAAGLTDAEGATGDACRTTSASPTSDCDRPDWVWVSDDLLIVRFAIGSPSASDHLPVEVTVAMP
jgi:endonuclease/exonuclease/phosphatase family metal-dependent hydrolase